MCIRDRMKEFFLQIYKAAEEKLELLVKVAASLKSKMNQLDQKQLKANQNYELLSSKLVKIMQLAEDLRQQIVQYEGFGMSLQELENEFNSLMLQRDIERKGLLDKLKSYSYSNQQLFQKLSVPNAFTVSPLKKKQQVKRVEQEDEDEEDEDEDEDEDDDEEEDEEDEEELPEKQVKMRFRMNSRTGYNPYNPNKINQDSFIIRPNLLDFENVHLFGVFDGHGSNGHFVSNFLKENLPIQLLSANDLTREPKQALYQGLKYCQDMLTMAPFDVSLSGTTALSLIHI
eukprot:TRINITY_DN441_c0_g2_i2.p1 TRINITY_DN441_c0_g2~~TRINITY_DN441_c0_g2_i2.p1  ORF type:complete len:286 (-),score=52.85 TRINITY_DN441_c0_g2_i2:37-894(-)